MHKGQDDRQGDAKGQDDRKGDAKGQDDRKGRPYPRGLGSQEPIHAVSDKLYQFNKEREKL